LLFSAWFHTRPTWHIHSTHPVCLFSYSFLPPFCFFEIFLYLPAHFCVKTHLLFSTTTPSRPPSLLLTSSVLSSPSFPLAITLFFYLLSLLRSSFSLCFPPASAPPRPSPLFRPLLHPHSPLSFPRTSFSPAPPITGNPARLISCFSFTIVLEFPPYLCQIRIVCGPSIFFRPPVYVLSFDFQISLFLVCCRDLQYSYFPRFDTKLASPPPPPPLHSSLRLNFSPPQQLYFPQPYSSSAVNAPPFVFFS